jgi:hypothetical protein
MINQAAYTGRRNIQLYRQGSIQEEETFFISLKKQEGMKEKTVESYL